MAAGSGSLELGLGLVNGVGQLDASLSTRINESVSLFASGGVDTSANWQTMAGLKVKW
jgi:hypothetical protein